MRAISDTAPSHPADLYQRRPATATAPANEVTDDHKCHDDDGCNGDNRLAAIIDLSPKAILER
jgi:hypothetical protein